jgi:hypothetical protein
MKIATTNNEYMDQLLTTNEAAALLALHPFTLHRWRCHGQTDLPWYKVAGRIRYRRGDLVAFVEAGRLGKAAVPTRPFGNREDGNGNGRPRKPQPVIGG